MVKNTLREIEDKDSFPKYTFISKNYGDGNFSSSIILMNMAIVRPVSFNKQLNFVNLDINSNSTMSIIATGARTAPVTANFSGNLTVSEDSKLEYYREITISSKGSITIKGQLIQTHYLSSLQVDDPQIILIAENNLEISSKVTIFCRT